MHRPDTSPKSALWATPRLPPAAVAVGDPFSAGQACSRLETSLALHLSNGSGSPATSQIGSAMCGISRVQAPSGRLHPAMSLRGRGPEPQRTASDEGQQQRQRRCGGENAAKVIRAANRTTQDRKEKKRKEEKSFVPFDKCRPLFKGETLERTDVQEILLFHFRSLASFPSPQDSTVFTDVRRDNFCQRSVVV
jgi:hypothetical protein